MKKINKFIVLLIFILLLFIFKSYPLQNYIKLNKFILLQNEIKAFINSKYLISVLIFIGTYLTSVLFLMPFEALLTAAAGFFFGFFQAVLYVDIAATLGGLSYLILSRYFIGKTIRNKFDGKFQNFNTNFEKQGLIYIITIRFIPILPSALINTLASFTKISPFNFIWTNALGIIPPTMLYAFIGKELGTMTSSKELFSYKIIIISILFALPFIISIVYKKTKKALT